MYTDMYDLIDYSIDSHFTGHSPDFLITPATESELFFNITIHTAYTLQIWGQLHTTQELPLYRVGIELFEVKSDKRTFQFRSLGLTYTDANGFYHFNIPLNFIYCYKLIVYSSNPLYNQILSPSLNACHAPNIHPCDQAFKHFLSRYSSRVADRPPMLHEANHCTTIYAVCHYA